jgi:hypothetical protein
VQYVVSDLPHEELEQAEGDPGLEEVNRDEQSVVFHT